MGDETKPAEVKEKRDWVKEAYECFVKNAVDSEPTDPVKAVEAYFQKNATDELKAAAKAEGKTAAGCWNFIEAVARKALGGKSGHIDPVAIYAIVMHYFQDVPKDWNEQAPAPKPAKPKPKPKSAKSKPAPGRARTPAAPPPTKPTTSQTFFFDLLEGGADNAH